MTWLLAWTAIKNGAGAAIGWIKANPLLAVIVALSIALAWIWHGRNVARADLAQHIAAEKAATGAQRRVNDAAKAHYERKADVADIAHADMVAEAFDATQRYIAERRLQPADRTCQAAPAASDQDPGVHDAVPASAVVVAETDVQRCAAWQAYGVAAHDWALSLKLPADIAAAE